MAPTALLLFVLPSGLYLPPQSIAIMQPNAQAEARATRYSPTPATKRTLWPVASSAVLGAASGGTLALPLTPQLGSATLPCPSAAVPCTFLRRPVSRQRWCHSHCWAAWPCCTR